MHNELLTKSEFDTLHIHGELVKRVIQEKGSIAITLLDWGSGRGADVIRWRQKGVHAFGAEISLDTIARGKALFAEYALDHDVLIQKINADNSTAFSDESFDYIVSYQVLEHVADLRSAAAEMARLLRPGGKIIHIYPAHLHPVEVHLSMPFVHWLPKNQIRRAAITLFTALGIEPDWPEVKGKSYSEKAAAYFSFSIDETFYRSPDEVRAIFLKAGIQAQFESHAHEKILRSPLLRCIPPSVLNYFLTRFVSCTLVGRRLTR